MKAFGHDLYIMLLLFLGFNLGLSVIRSRGNSILIFDEIMVLVFVAFMIVFELYLTFSLYFFGQTLGAKRYGLKVISENGEGITLWQSWKRSIFMLGGSMFLFEIFTSDRKYKEAKGRYSWDAISKTQVIDLDE
jgi:uncharacterized RDD family membrane protein YckC